MPQSPASSSNDAWRLAAFVAGLLGYGWLFYSAHPFLIENLGALLLPDDILRIWTGGGSQRFGLFDRWPILLLAGTILLTAYAAGRLTLAWIGFDRGLTCLERWVFSIGVGLGELSTATLAMGPIGLCGATET